MKLILLLAALLPFSPAFAAEPEHPCEDIMAACEAAHFAKGLKGADLWKECIEPLVERKPQPKTATKPLPKVDPAAIAGCQAKHGISTGK